MRPMQFGVVNLVSAIGWALAYVMPGVFFGTSLAVAGAVSARLALIVFILFAGIWGFIWLSRKLVSLLENRGSLWLAAMKGWATADRPASGLKFVLKSGLRHLFLRQQSEALFFLCLCLMLILSGWGFLGVLQDVLAKDPLVMADQAVYHFFQSLRTPWADRIFVAVTELGDSFVNLSLAAGVLLVLLGRRCYRTAGYWTATIAGGLLGIQVLKWVVHLPRPVALYHGASAYGFPSGHTSMSMILYGFLAILLARRLTGVWRWGLFSSVIVISFVIGISRLYLGAHWLSDVLGGLFIGTCWTALLGIAFLNGSVEIVPRRLLGLVVFLVVGGFGGLHVAQYHEKDLAFYAPQHTVRSIFLAAWRSGDWRDLPAWRIDMAGEREQPLTIQRLGSVKELARDLLNAGWQHPPPLNLRGFLGLFSPDTPVEKLLSLPRLHDGMVERLHLVYIEQEKRLVIRLWPSDVDITENDTPIFLGTIVEQRRRHLAGLITTAWDTGGYEHPLDVLKRMLIDHFDLKVVHRPKDETRVAGEHRRPNWQGSVLLVSEKTE
jgi:undecaprenyl-diphosphatase